MTGRHASQPSAELPAHQIFYAVSDPSKVALAPAFHAPTPAVFGWQASVAFFNCLFDVSHWPVKERGGACFPRDRETVAESGQVSLTNIHTEICSIAIAVQC